MFESIPPNPSLAVHFQYVSRDASPHREQLAMESRELAMKPIEPGFDSPAG